MNPSPVPIRRYALVGIVAVVLLNLLLRTFVKLGGLFTTALIAAAVAGGMALWFAWRNGRAPRRGERRRLVWLYGGVLGLLYLGLLVLMALKDEPSPMSVLIVTLHYLCYPLMAQAFCSERFFKHLG